MEDEENDENPFKDFMAERDDNYERHTVQEKSHMPWQEIQEEEEDELGSITNIQNLLQSLGFDPAQTSIEDMEQIREYVLQQFLEQNQE